MAKPEVVADPIKQARLEESIDAILNRQVGWADMKDINFASMLAQCVIREAAKFFAYCPEEFGLEVGGWESGHLVFGGTNRLHWSLMNGFWPDKEYCSPRFLAQFAGEVWEVIGYLDESFNPDPRILIMAAGHPEAIEVPVAWPNKHHSIQGRRGKDGRIAEVSFRTGTEA